MMRHKIGFSGLVLFCILSLCSCKQDQDMETLPDHLLDDNQTEAPYYLEYNSDFSYTAGNDNTLNIRQGQVSELFSDIRSYQDELYVCTNDTMCRYNPATGNVTAVCQKPDCPHNTISCPFAGIFATEFSIINNSIYFTAAESARKRGIIEKDGVLFGHYVYDLEEDILKRSKAKRSSYNTWLNGMFIDTEGCQYYYDTRYDEKNDTYSYDLCKYSPASEQTEVLQTFREDVLDDNIIPMFIDTINDKLYYLDGTGIRIFHGHTDNKEEVYRGYAVDVAHDSEYFYFMDEQNFLYRFPISGQGEAEQLTDCPVRYYCITNTYVYYQIKESVLVGKFADGSDADIGSQTIYRMGKDGSNKEQVWKFENQFSLMNCTYFIVEGNYLYSFFFYWDNEKQNFIESGYEIDGKSYMIRIDVNTQEVCFIDMTL